MSAPRILVACETSGQVRRAFAAKGWDAWSCDLLPADDGETERHIQGDARPLLTREWDLVIAHPPCTRLCNSGVRWLHSPPRGKTLEDMRRELAEGVDLFLACLAAFAPRIAVENPVMHKHARNRIGRGPDFTVQPWQFGDDFKKRTCFWTHGLPPLKPTSDRDGSTARAEVHLASPGPDRWKKRSATYPGLARAMADQWGQLGNKE